MAIQKYMSTTETLHDFNYYHIKALKDKIKELENEIKALKK